MHLDPATTIAGFVAQAAMAADPEASPTLLTYIRDGGALSYVLIALSVLAVALTVRNILALRTREFAPPEVMSTLELLLGEGRVAEAERYCKDPANRCFVTTVLAEAFARARTSGFGLLEFRGAVEEVARGEADNAAVKALLSGLKTLDGKASAAERLRDPRKADEVRLLLSGLDAPEEARLRAAADRLLQPPAQPQPAARAAPAPGAPLPSAAGPPPATVYGPVTVSVRKGSR